MRVIAIGSPHGDDAVGPAVVAELERLGADAELAFARDPAELVLLLEGQERVVLVDAVAGAGEPGTVLHLTPERLAAVARPISSHGLSVPRALELARALNGASRIDIVGVAIDAAQAAPGERPGLSAPVSAAVPKAAALVRSLLLG